MRLPKSKEQAERDRAKAEAKIAQIKSFRRSRHYKVIMDMLEFEFNKDSLDGKYGKLTSLEQIGMIAAIQSESKTRFNNVKNVIEGI